MRGVVAHIRNRYSAFETVGGIHAICSGGGDGNHAKLWQLFQVWPFERHFVRDGNRRIAQSLNNICGASHRKLLPFVWKCGRAKFRADAIPIKKDYTFHKKAPKYI